MWNFPKSGVPFYGVLIKIIVFWGSTLGSLTRKTIQGLSIHQAVMSIQNKGCRETGGTVSLETVRLGWVSVPTAVTCTPNALFSSHENPKNRQ